MQETSFWNAFRHERLCPVLLGCIGGFFIVMPRVEAISRQEFFTAFDFDAFINVDDWVIPVEDKLDSFGKYGGKIVAVDYGS